MQIFYVGHKCSVSLILFVYIVEGEESMNNVEVNHLKEKYELILKKSLEKLLENDYELLENNTHEVTISSLLARYINDFTSNDSLIENGSLNVDIEYNRMPDIEVHESQKRISKAIYITSFHGERQDLHNVIRRNVRPDIIVHQRRVNVNNILWLELKLNVDEFECRFDMQKAWYAISQLQYKLGVSVLVDTNTQIIVFNWIDSNEVERIEYEIEHKHLRERNRLIRLYIPG